MYLKLFVYKEENEAANLYFESTLSGSVEWCKEILANKFSHMSLKVINTIKCNH